MNNVHSDQFFHPWHSLSVGTTIPTTVTSVIEITQGSKAKYELDKQTGFLRLDRILASTLSYPFHYGFIPQTYCEDKDPLDIIILCSEPLIPLSIVEVTVLGAIEMIDSGEQDDKIIGVATHDPFMKYIKELDDINPEVLNGVKHFFEEYKKPEGKQVLIKEFLSRLQAYKLVTTSINLYQKAKQEGILLSSFF